MFREDFKRILWWSRSPYYYKNYYFKNQNSSVRSMTIQGANWIVSKSISSRVQVKLRRKFQVSPFGEGIQRRGHNEGSNQYISTRTKKGSRLLVSFRFMDIKIIGINPRCVWMRLRRLGSTFFFAQYGYLKDRLKREVKVPFFELLWTLLNTLD
jgi:hypothetical protein